MRLDSDIKRDVEDELRWDPDLDAIDIGVTVHNGVLTLGGFVASFAQKSQAWPAASTWTRLTSSAAATSCTAKPTTCC